MSSLDKIRKERRDLAILIIAFGLVIGCVLYDLARAVYFQGISHPVASTLGHDIAPGGRVPFQHTSPIGIRFPSSQVPFFSFRLDGTHYGEIFS